MPSEVPESAHANDHRVPDPTILTTAWFPTATIGQLADESSGPQPDPQPLLLRNARDGSALGQSETNHIGEIGRFEIGAERVGLGEIRTDETCEDEVGVG